MSDKEILDGIKQYFSIKELVDNTTYANHNENAWQFLDLRLLETLLVIREALNKPMTVNRGTMQQRGLRTNICNIVKKKTEQNRLYLSAHVMGKAVDFDVKGMTAEEVRQWIVENEDILPYKVRLEHKMKGKPISWVHLDVYYREENPKVYLFNV